MKQILNNTFIQLISIYFLVILLISIGLFWKYSLQFHIAAIIISLFGISILPKELKQTKLKYFNILFGLAIFLTLSIRLLPQSPMPLGYDAGIYKYGIENFRFFQSSSWLKATFTPGFLYLTFLLKQIFTTNAILTYIFTIFNLILGLTIYLTTKEYFNKRVGLIAFLIYSVSIIQFKVFTYLYYKNILGLITALLAIYFLKKKRIPFIIFSVLTAIIHRPTFFVLGLSYLIHTIINENKKQHIINGISILIISTIFYIGYFKESILPLISPIAKSFIETGTAPGTFINFLTYQYSVLAYLPLALLGLFYLIKRKDFNLITLWTVISFLIVYFQFFFFNRFIIMLDIALIILASLGIEILYNKNKKLATIITIIFLVSLSYVTISEAINTKPLITNEELDTIKELNNTEENAYVMATSSIYSPYVLGYSNRKTIAPGLFQYNKHNEEEWIIFWTTDNIEEIKQFLSEYEKPLYIFIGKKQQDNLEQFEECFKLQNETRNKIYKYTC